MATSNCSQSRTPSARYARIPAWPWEGARIATSVEAGSKTTSSASSATRASASRAANAWKSWSTTSLGAAIRRPAPGLLHEDHFRDLEIALEALDHVVDRQRGDARGGERLHLDAGAGGRARLCGEGHDAGLRVDLGLYADEAQRERVAQGDEV